MAVVVSQSQNEIADMRELGLDIAPHRKRMLEEDLDERFKDPDDPFRLVFVCAMWMTGFDVPSCSTIYLDRPMRNHTLMQTIARANRVFPEKENGLIVDYVGVFRRLEEALAIYAAARDGEEALEIIRDKSALVERARGGARRADRVRASAGTSTSMRSPRAEGFEFIALRDAVGRGAARRRRDPARLPGALGSRAAAVRGDPARPGRDGARARSSGSPATSPRRSARSIPPPDLSHVAGRRAGAARPLGRGRGVRDPRGRGRRRRRRADRPERDRLRRARRAARRQEALVGPAARRAARRPGRGEPRGATRRASISSSGCGS